MVGIIIRKCKIKQNTGKMHEMLENASVQSSIGFGVYLICWDGGVSLLDQSQSEVKQYQSDEGLLSILNWIFPSK